MNEMSVRSVLKITRLLLLTVESRAPPAPEHHAVKGKS